MTFRGLGHDPRQVVGRVEDVVVGNLCEAHHGSSDRLVAPLLFLVRLVQGQFRPYFGGVCARDLQKSLHDESTLVRTFFLSV